MRRETMQACCTCATLLTQVPRYADNEKPLPNDRALECCPRVICGNCIHNNYRFQTYCPYCQISTTPSRLPQGLKEPPSYNSAAESSKDSRRHGPPPPYSASVTTNTTAGGKRHVDPLDEKSVPLDNDEEVAEDVLHFLNHEHDTVTSLSLRYGVPANVLRRANNITSDHLILGRKTVIIPGEYYKGGVSLSPTPIDGEEEELRKGKIRRFMVACKVSEYDVAVLYLQQSDYDLEAATIAYIADEEWEASHPVEGALGKKTARAGGAGLGRSRGFQRGRGR
ncbi:hypothetical protein PFICI_03786 [Pestalotiopsis fici W106-1]|uniref:LysM domain-containing protein n=1 Tax=Pestalotiopsis fici (strain W106-1 / CGMCC3.15140) TaxID=1229662 RepID=W3XKL8_PESFW|nr:uncharacterized protein PFICI_03786 [Pestalotiopsis fici W106-1]ETS85761.1 hypothetical protein PFICI_03786 [Pestalotiopsis fici W106-1]